MRQTAGITASPNNRLGTCSAHRCSKHLSARLRFCKGQRTFRLTSDNVTQQHRSRTLLQALTLGSYLALAVFASTFARCVLKNCSLYSPWTCFASSAAAVSIFFCPSSCAISCFTRSNGKVARDRIL